LTIEATERFQPTHQQALALLTATDPSDGRWEARVVVTQPDDRRMRRSYLGRDD
jgi:hypothetical protein